jgi:tetratricopeptide (TPR) repeat protein
MRRILTMTMLSVAGALALAAAQDQRPKNVPFYTWVREDTFAGFLGDDMTRFERGMQKTQEYLAEDPNNMDALNWLGAGTLYRAVRAFKAGDEAKGDALFADAMAKMDKAAATAPGNIGVRATAGGTILVFASQLPDRHYTPALERARQHYAALYTLQEAQLDHFPPHIKGEALAGVAETEFRVGDRQKAIAYLDRIVAGMPGTRYAQIAETWRTAPERVAKSDKLACQSCHEQGRLASWMKTNPQ